MTGLLSDIRHGLRRLARNFRVTLLAGLILGLALGGTAAIFGLIDAVFLRPLGGIAEPRQLVRFERVQPGLSATNFSYPDYLAYRDENRSFAGLAAHCAAPLSISDKIRERIHGDLVTGNYFSVLGVKPALGRLLGSNDEGLPGTPAVTVLSYSLWRRVFASDPSVLGKQVSMNGHGFTVIGVAEPNFTGVQIGQATDAWIPLSMQPWGISRLSQGVLLDRAAGWIDIFGRVRRGVTVAQTQADISAVASRLAKAYPITNGHRSVRLLAGVGMDPDDQQDLGNLLMLLFAGAGTLLLVAAANVASLLLAQTIAQERETAVRLAIGAGPAQILRQRLVEGLLLCSVAGALALLMTPWIIRLTEMVWQSSPLLHGIHAAFDWRIVVFIVALVVTLGVAAGLVPARSASKLDLASSLKEARSSARQPRMQQLLVVFQLALSFLLLNGAGLMLRTVHALASTDPGFDPRNVLLLSLDVGIQGYSESRGQEFYRALLERTEGVPGVRSASVAQMAPPQEFGSRVSLFQPGHVPPLEMLHGREFETGLRVDANFVAPHYFRTLEIRVISGRDFMQHDNENSAPVAIVNSALAERLWPGQYAVGKQIVWPSWDGTPRAPLTVVGVVGNTRQRSMALKPPLLLYVPVAQNYIPAVTLLVRTTNNPATMAHSIAKQIAALDRSVAVFHPETLEEHVSESLWRQHAALDTIASFGILSIIVAVVGLFGVMSQWVLARMREIGIRMALGANRKDVSRFVFRHGSSLVLAGVGIGSLAALSVAAFESNAFASIIYGTSVLDPLVLGSVALLLLVIALLSSIAPLLRALRADPAATLRAE